MISDTLSDAAHDIRDYLDNPMFAQVYEGEVRQEVLRVLAEMDTLLERLDPPTPKVTKLAFHRNGVCGEPFWVGLIRDGANTLLAIMPVANGDPAEGARCYVIDPAKAADGVIGFGENSWRGDRYAHVMRTVMRTATLAEPSDD